MRLLCGIHKGVRRGLLLSQSVRAKPTSPQSTSRMAASAVRPSGDRPSSQVSKASMGCNVQKSLRIVQAQATAHPQAVGEHHQVKSTP